MTQAKLQLGDYGYLDISDDTAIPLNLNLNDFRDITVRNGTWSKTIKLPGTNNNNSILEYVFDVNINTLTFNPKIKENIRIIIDGFVAFEGIFQLKKVNKKYNNMQDFRIEYDCFVTSDTPSFYSDIDGKYVDDIELLLNAKDGVSYPNIEPTMDNILHSMTGGTVLDGYQWYLPYTANVNPDYSPQILIPGIYAKVIWDNIFWNAGYEYQFDELQELNFDKLIIPWTGGFFNQFDKINKEFRVGRSQSDYFMLLWKATSTNILPTAPYTLYQENIIFNDANNALENWFDNPQVYDINDGSIYVYGNTYAQDINIKFYADVVFQLINQIDPNITASDIVNTGRFQLFAGLDVLVKDLNGNTIGQVYADLNMYEIGTIGNNPILDVPLSNLQNVDAVNWDITFHYAPNIYPNAAYLQPRLRIAYLNNPLQPFKNFYSQSTGQLYNPRLLFNLTIQNDESGHISNSVDNTLVEGSVYRPEQLLPKKLKQSDFILSFIKMYNLMMFTDTDYPNKLIFKTRDRFYAEGEELNWTDKLDIRSVDIELLSNSIKKRTKFTHKQDDKDYLLKSYEDEVSEIYGQQEYVFQNEFIRDIETIETSFSPAIALTNHNNQVPYIDSLTATNVKILYVGDVITGQWVYYNGYGNLPGNFFYNNKYRYAGHFYPNQIDPQEDLNYGICDYYAHSYNSITNNNLYNRFYRTQMNIFETGYLMTAYFNLSYLDFSNLKMSERIYVFDSWWNVNKVQDFDLNGNKLTKVELITADISISDFKPYSFKKKNSNNNNKIQSTLNEISSNKVDNSVGRDVSGVVILGHNNIIQENSHNSLILGDFNRLQANNSIINGYGNLVTADNVIALGLNNQVFDQPDTTTVNTLIQQVHIIDAGREEVLNPYPTNKIINWIDAGREEVRPVGGFSIESFIDCGRDKVI